MWFVLNEIESQSCCLERARSKRRMFCLGWRTRLLRSFVDAAARRHRAAALQGSRQCARERHAVKNRSQND
jgi:hypothetical protein